MSQFKVGDFVEHKLRKGVSVGIKMLVCAVREKGDRWRGEEFSIGCRWWDERAGIFWEEWFAAEELEVWKD